VDLFDLVWCSEVWIVNGLMTIEYVKRDLDKGFICKVA
jgi:hypothetical protein